METSVDTAAPMLQGPGSLSSREPGDTHDSSDFVVIDGSNGSMNGYADSEADLFSSLSQADAVAQVKELIQQRDALRKSFTACTQDLSNVNHVCQELKSTERKLCEQAKKRIEALNEELELYKTENTRLTQELSVKSDLAVVHPVERLTSSSTSDTAMLVTSTACPASDDDSTLEPTDGIASVGLDTHVPSIRVSERDAMIEQLRGQVTRLQEANIKLELTMRDVQLKADEQIKKSESDKERATRLSATMSTRITALRDEKQEVEEELQDARTSIHELEQQLTSQEESSQYSKGDYERLVAEKEEMQREMVNPLKEKLAALESELREEKALASDTESQWRAKYKNLEEISRDTQARYQEVDAQCRGLEETYTALEGDCRRKAEMIEQLRSDSQRRCQELTNKNRDLERIAAEHQNDGARKAEMIEQLKKEKANAEYRFEETRVDKRKADDLIAVLRSNIKESANRLAAMAALQTENRELKQRNSDNYQKIDELNQRIEEYNLSVGDEVPELIRKNDELKTKLKGEQATSDQLRDEVQQQGTRATKAENSFERTKRNADQLNKLVTELKQKNAQLEGQIIQLNQELGELNSRNVTDGQFAPPMSITRAALNDLQRGPTPSAHGTMQSVNCPFNCNISGDADFIANHIARDHPEGE